MTDRRTVYQQFLETFPLESLKDLPLERYTNLNRSDSFCYWIETKTTSLGSFWGGSSYKFGIYKYNNKPNETDARIKYDDSYAWYTKYNKETAEEAYEIVRDAVVKVAEFAHNGEFESIETDDILGDSFKWKIAFLYSGLNLVPIYKKEMLDAAAKGKGMENPEKKTIPEIQRFLFSQKPEGQDFFEYYDTLLDIINAATPLQTKLLFEEVMSILKEDERFCPKQPAKSYMWIGTRDGIIGSSKCHYELITGANSKAGHIKNQLYVEIHFEDADAPKFQGLESIPGIISFKWNKYGVRLDNSGLPMIGAEAHELAECAIEQLRLLDDTANTMISELMGHKINYWTYAPGNNACFWEECYSGGIMLLGWDDLGDFSQYETKDALRKAAQEVYGEDNSHKNSVHAVWQFKNELKTGDIVYAKNGLYNIIGRGIVTSNEYIFDESRDEYMSVRYIQWTNKGEWSIENALAQKALTCITGYTELIEQLEAMITGKDEKTDSMNKHQEYIDLLTASKNIILTGAPGTGKTYLAQKIAEEMGAKTDFVQFHPSYDYTDFVEGLRPSDNGSFERRDGIFKVFCKAALKNLEDSKKTQKALAEEKNIDERIDAFLASAIENQAQMELKSGNKFTITDYTEKIIRVESKDNEKTPRIDIKMSEVRELLEKNVQLDNVHDIRDHFGRKFGTQQDSYTFVITCAIKAMKTISIAPIDKVERKNFVFIIDEINRGEMSKILGELFFSIDPGYRGEKGRVKTQYQNLIEDDDVFANGFFIPENVYIIGTMNDIDRSVESMDFAIRRRFTWKEVLPENRLDMWDECQGDWKEEAKKRMRKLNDVIGSGRVGLTPEYSIGPAYFRNLDNYNGDFSTLWSLHLEPLLKEYLRGSRNTTEYLGKLKKAYELIDEPESANIDL